MDRKRLVALLLLVAGALAASCGGGNAVPPAVVTVVVTPSSTSVEVFTSQPFSAIVSGTANTAVTWQVNGVAGGSASTGTISATGLYHAPHSVPVRIVPGGNSETTHVTVTAVSQADSSASGSATVTVSTPNKSQQSTPIALGTTGGNANDSSTSGGSTTCCEGTLGALVTRVGTPYILSNNHILVQKDLVSIGDPIIQPGLIESPVKCRTTGTTLVGNLAQAVILESNKDANGSFHPAADAAMAQVVPGTIDPSGAILLLGDTVDADGIPVPGAPHAGAGVAPAVGVPVAKSGRSTGLTCSTIGSIVGAISVSYELGCGAGPTFDVIYSNQVVILGGEFSAAGDSGSLIVTQDTADPVALLYAGSDTDTIGNPIADVLNALPDPNNITPTFVGGAAHPVLGCSLPVPRAAVEAVGPVNAAALLRATEVRNRHAAELLAHPAVQALGAGASLDQPGEPAVLFFVTGGQPRKDIPAQVEGMRTRIIEGDLFAGRGIVSPGESAALERAAPAAAGSSRLSSSEVARARLVHAAHVDALMKQPGVQGVGIASSADAPGEAALMIYLIRGVPHGEVPAVVDGLRTRVKESSRFLAGLGGTRPARTCAAGAAPAKAPRHAQTHDTP